jgi:uncharacterized protein (TIGR02145 family)
MRIVILLPILFIALTANAQNHLITFTGTGAATTVTTVKVENLTSGTSLSLNGSDILRLTGSVGIPQLVNNNSQEMKIYPNPMNGRTTVEFYAPVAGDAAITIYEMTGKTIVQVRSYLENSRQEFKLSGLKNGLYLINVTGNAYQFSGKLLCNGAEDGSLIIENAGNSYASLDKQFSKKEYNESQATVDMLYTNGDRLKFTGISGNYSTVKTDIPTQNKTLSFNFIECKDGDNNNYPIVEIGTQVWMAENVKTSHYRNGDAITNVTSNSQWVGQTTGAYCDYNNIASNSATYGKLYNWHAVNDTRNIAPVGWHIASNAEWKTLTAFLGGIDIAGSKLKETGTSKWPGPNASATNESGFTALPGGSRWQADGAFGGLGYVSSFWSDTPDGTSAGLEIDLAYDVDTVAFYSDSRTSGYSVRCIKDSETSQIPVLTTSVITNISQSSATGGGNISNDGGTSIISRGVCWSTNQSPTISNSKSSNGTGIGIFSSNITSLLSNTTYYVRAYATNSVGTGYGNQVSFITSQIIGTPILTTVSPVTDITTSSATCGGNVSADGGASVTSRGVCWSTIQAPTTANSKTSNGTGTGSFTSNLTGLTSSTTYYVRAYAVNSAGTSYGNEVSFSTSQNISIPTVTTLSPVSNIKTTTAACGGDVIDDGGASVTARGSCWSIAANPIVTDNKTIDGTGIGSFTSSIVGLLPGTTYYIRAYATNSAGTGYGEEISFTTDFAIGQAYQGGIIAYIWLLGDDAYVSGQVHGIIAAPSDITKTARWLNNGTYTITGATGTGLGIGFHNTEMIVANQGDGSYAAKLCYDLVLGGYSDWCLPSKDELNKLYINRELIGGFDKNYSYWSSSEGSLNFAWNMYFFNGIMSSAMKEGVNAVRAVRKF